MDRRNFLKNIIGGVATSAAVRTWPFRVFSFPSEPRIPSSRIDFLDMEQRGRVFMQEIQVEKDLSKTNYIYGIAYYQDVPPTRWLNLERFSWPSLSPVVEVPIQELQAMYPLRG